MAPVWLFAIMLFWTVFGLLFKALRYMWQSFKSQQQNAAWRNLQKRYDDSKVRIVERDFTLSFCAGRLVDGREEAFVRQETRKRRQCAEYGEMKALRTITNTFIACKCNASTVGDCLWEIWDDSQITTWYYRRLGWREDCRNACSLLPTPATTLLWANWKVQTICGRRARIWAERTLFLALVYMKISPVCCRLCRLVCRRNCNSKHRTGNALRDSGGRLLACTCCRIDDIRRRNSRDRTIDGERREVRAWGLGIACNDVVWSRWLEL